MPQHYTPTGRPTGRPSDYTPETSDAICALLAQGTPLVAICQREDMPGLTTVYRWLREREDFRQAYARAREDQADTLADEITRIADEQGAVTRNGVTYDPDVNRDRLRVDARKWVAAKLKPKKYGDKIDHEHSGGVKVEFTKSDAGVL